MAHHGLWGQRGTLLWEGAPASSLCFGVRITSAASVQYTQAPGPAQASHENAASAAERGYGHRPAVILSPQEQWRTLSSLLVPQLPRSVSPSLSLTQILFCIYICLKFSNSGKSESCIGTLSFPQKNKAGTYHSKAQI